MKRLALLFLLAACSKSGLDHEDSAAKMAAFAERACACKNKACAAKAADDMNAWARETYARLGKAAEEEAPAEIQARITADLQKLQQCYDNAPRF